MPSNSDPMVRVEVRGKSRGLALWPYGQPTEGALRELHYTVMRGASVVRSYDSTRAQIEQDPRLSDVAKREDVRKAALAQLSALTTTHKNLRNEAEAINERRRTLLEVKPYAPNDYATVAIDLAMAAHLRTLDEAGRVRAMGTDPRVADAVARLPPTLTGISEGAKQRLLADAALAKNPVEAQELETLSEALRYAHEGLANAARTIATDAGLEQAQFAPFAHIGQSDAIEPAAEPTDDTPQEETA